MPANSKSSEVKERILDVARDLFIRKGFKGASIRDIAAASGTNVAMVHYYFHSKYNLFEIIFEEAFEHLRRKVFAALLSELPFFELIETIVCSYYEMLSEYPQIPVFVINEINQDPVRLSARMQARDPQGVFLKMSARIREEEMKGSIRETPPADFLLNLLSLCVFPFVSKDLVGNLSGLSQPEYSQVIENHKYYVIQFVINALKKQ
jgi:AcrR family transcriptional regulator